jgi:glycerol 3-phosphatase-2
VSLRPSPRPLQGVHDLLVLDLDGVVYVGPDAVPGAVPALAAARRAGTTLCFATNNASRTPEDVAAHLRALGVPAEAGQVATSSQAAAALALDALGPGARVLAVGGPGVAAALQDVGLVPVGTADDSPAAVVQGFGPHVGWAHLAEAALAVRAGAVWVATNTDATLPTPRGPVPGNGALVAAVRTATDREPLVAGKPEPVLFEVAAHRAAAERPLVVGDRLDTDVAAASRAGFPSLLVLTGVTGPVELLAAVGEQRPTFVAADLHGLGVPHPAPRRDGARWRCGNAWAVVREGGLTGDATPGAELDLLRAACAAAWEAADVGAAPTVAAPLAERLDAARAPGPAGGGGR